MLKETTGRDGILLQLTKYWRRAEKSSWHEPNINKETEAFIKHAAGLPLPWPGARRRWLCGALWFQLPGRPSGMSPCQRLPGSQLCRESAGFQRRLCRAGQRNRRHRFVSNNRWRFNVEVTSGKRRNLKSVQHFKIKESGCFSIMFWFKKGYSEWWT